MTTSIHRSSGAASIGDSDAIWTHPERMWGQPCFRDTRVPVDFLFEWLAAGDSVADFVENYPNVAPERVAAALREAAGLLVDRRKSA